MAPAYTVSNGYTSSDGDRSSAAPASAGAIRKQAPATGKSANAASATAADDEDEGAADESQRKKRKKAVRACNHCQTAHLTCDDNRPCGRCIKRSLGDTCMDGARKKAKYLRDIEDALVNAGKANPTHFIHSPPAGNESVEEQPQHQTDPSGIATARDPVDTQSGSYISVPPPARSEHSSHSSNGPTPRVPSSSLPEIPSKNAKAPTLSPVHNVGVLSDVNASSNDQHYNSDLLGSNLSLQYGIPSDNTTHATSASQLQPFNFFNDLDGGGAGNFTTGNNNSANLEYAVLSSMLQNSGYGNASPMGFGAQLQPPSSAIYQGIFTGSGDYGQMSFGFPPAAFENSPNNINGNANGNMNTSNSNSSGNHSNQYSSHADPKQHDINTYLSNNGQQQHTNNAGSLPSLHTPTNAFGALPIDHNWPTMASTLPGGADMGLQAQNQQSQQHQRSSLPDRHSPSYPAAGHADTTISNQNAPPVISSTGVMKVEDVYKHINKPHNYLEAYHALIRYLQFNFENKANVLRIIRALSIYRPSIIALHMPLTLEDEIFVERSFQRTLIEIEKLISFSGTPTLVWRRTGEIVLVGTEFSLLSEWKREDLLCRDRSSSNSMLNNDQKTTKDKKSSKSKRRYIFEVFDQDSLVEYYETFAQHAFESSSATIMSTCNIVTPKGRKVPCTFGYNLKRDIFGLPQMVLGQFLPILTAPEEPSQA